MTREIHRSVWATPPSVNNGPFAPELLNGPERDLEIAYVGNSVTAQKGGFQSYLHEQITQRGWCRASAIKVALGAIGSIGIASYWEILLRDRRPDVVFLECSTADIGYATPIDDIEVALRHLVAAMRKLGSQICFLHMPRSDRHAARRRDVLRIYDHVARDFEVSSIDLEFSDALEDTEQYLYDGVHTTPFGASVVAEAIFNALSEQVTETPAIRVTQPDSSSYGPELLIRGWQGMEYEPAPSTGTFRFGIPFAETNIGGTAIWESSSHQLLGLQILLGAHSGVIEITDDHNSLTIQTWDRTCIRNPRLSYLPIPPLFRRSNRITFRAVSEDRGHRDLFGGSSHDLHHGLTFRIIGYMETCASQQSKSGARHE